MSEDSNISEKKLIELLLSAKSRHEIVQICKNHQIPFEQFKFTGYCKKSTLGVSYITDEFIKSSNQWRFYFCRSSKKRGEILNYEGSLWMVVWNSCFYPSGDFSSTTHVLIIVSLKSFSK